MQDLDPTTIQEWRLFCLQAEALLESGEELMNRRRIPNTFDDLGVKIMATGGRSAGAGG